MKYAFAGDATNEKHKCFLTIFGGPVVQPDLENVLIFKMRFEDDTYMAATALAREFWRYKIGSALKLKVRLVNISATNTNGNSTDC